jgi:hypothetical protein
MNFVKFMTAFSIVLLALSFTFSPRGAWAFDFGTTPDFLMFVNYEKSVIAKHPDVVAYVRLLGAQSFKVTMAKPGRDLYAVLTSNGCEFDVRVVYETWPGIDQVIVAKNAICR